MENRDVQQTSLNRRVIELLRFTETHNRHANALAQATGDRFNVFNILGVGRREVTTHSPILAELLDPQGRHGQRGCFLRLFLSKFQITGFDADSAHLKTEHFIGKVTEKSGGRIDILITDAHGKMIIIENKIDAGDQDNQMARYREFNKSAHLFYLTLDGRKPGNLSEVELQNVESISYGGKILDWLRDCRKEAACLPNVRETVSQYIHLVEELTNQGSNIRMNEEIVNAIVTSDEGLRAYGTLRELESDVQQALLPKLDGDLTELANELNLTRIDPERIEWSASKYDHFGFTTPGLKQRNLQIRFEFDGANYTRFYFGFRLIDFPGDCAIAAEVLSKFRESFPGAKVVASWPAWTWWPEYENWNMEGFVAIRNGRLKEDLRIKLKQLIVVADAVCRSNK